MGTVSTIYWCALGCASERQEQQQTSSCRHGTRPLAIGNGPVEDTFNARSVDHGGLIEGKNEIDPAPPVLRNDKTPRAEAQGVLVDIRSASNGASLQRFTHFVPFTHRPFRVSERKLSWCWRDLQGTDSPFSFRKRRTRRPSRSVAARRPLLHPSWPLAVAGWAFRVFPARASSPKQMWVQRGPSWSSLHLQSAG